MKQAADIESWLSLTLIDGVGGESIRRLLVAFGNPAAILSAPIIALERLVKKTIAARIKQGADRNKITDVLKWLEDPTNAIITLADTDYPSQLLNITDPPPLLYFKGRRELLQFPALAVVGSRNATPQGLSNAEAFSEASSNADLHYQRHGLGIDTVAHQGGLRGTAASIKSSAPDWILFIRQKPPARSQIGKEGALISEFPLGTPAIGRNFPRRNRHQRHEPGLSCR